MSGVGGKNYDIYVREGKQEMWGKTSKVDLFIAKIGPKPTPKQAKIDFFHFWFKYGARGVQKDPKPKTRIENPIPELIFRVPEPQWTDNFIGLSVRVRFRLFTKTGTR